jgi:hypothetical protein
MDLESLWDWIRANPKKSLAAALAILGFLVAIGERVFRGGEWFAEAEQSHELTEEHDGKIDGLVEFTIRQVEREKMKLERQEIRAEEKALRAEYIEKMCRADCARVGVSIP